MSKSSLDLLNQMQHENKKEISGNLQGATFKKDPEKDDEARENQARRGGDAMFRDEEAKHCCCGTDDHLEEGEEIKANSTGKILSN